MLLSEILNDMGLKNKYNVINEQDFTSLSLIVSENNEKNCIFIDDVKFISKLKNNTKMIITTDLAYDSIRNTVDVNKVGFCITSKPRVLFFEIHNFLSMDNRYVGATNKTIIGENCKISNLSVISENNVKIGDNVTIEEFVVIRENTTIGDNSIIRSGVKIGGEGFEFKKNESEILSVKHLGKVDIGKNVEIQYNSCVDKAVYPWDATIIGDYTKIDSHVQISHAVKIGKCTLITAQSVIGGRTIIGNNVWLGFASIVSNGIKIGNNSRVNIGSVVTKNVESGDSVTGNFAIEHRKFIENLKRSVE